MIISPYQSGFIDPTVMSVVGGLKTEANLVPVTINRPYVFNVELNDLKDWVLIDYCEYGANDWDRKNTHIWGKNTLFFSHFANSSDIDEWMKFDEFVAHNPPRLTFKRELLKKDMSATVRPIEYPAFQGPFPIQSQGQFDDRPITIYNVWGWSHEARRRLHGEIWEAGAMRGWNVVDNFSDIPVEIGKGGPLFVTIYAPHYRRADMELVMRYNGMSAVSVSLPGAGVKCFRHAEASANAVMYMHEDELAWSYPWIRNENCLKSDLRIYMDEIRGVGHQSDIFYLEASLRDIDLYQVYLNGMKNHSNYIYKNYLSNYLEPLINQNDERLHQPVHSAGTQE